MINTYLAPSILKKLTVQLEVDILAGSVVTEDTSIQTAGPYHSSGQQQRNHDIGRKEKNANWEIESYTGGVYTPSANSVRFYTGVSANGARRITGVSVTYIP